MDMISKIIFTFLLIACGSPELTSNLLDRDPTGDTTHYVVNKDRTMSQIKSGTFDISIAELNADNEYPVVLDYSFKIVFIGQKTGTAILPIGADYWTTEYWYFLRSMKHYENPKYKIDHLGYKTVVMNDISYYCDYVKIYDVKIESADLSQVIVYAPVNIDMIPALGAVQVDITGQVSGTDIKVGADLAN